MKKAQLRWANGKVDHILEMYVRGFPQEIRKCGGEGRSFPMGFKPIYGNFVMGPDDVDLVVYNDIVR